MAVWLLRVSLGSAAAGNVTIGRRSCVRPVRKCRGPDRARGRGGYLDLVLDPFPDYSLSLLVDVPSEPDCPALPPTPPAPPVPPLPPLPPAPPEPAIAPPSPPSPIPRVEISCPPFPAAPPAPPGAAFPPLPPTPPTEAVEVAAKADVAEDPAAAPSARRGRDQRVVLVVDRGGAVTAVAVGAVTPHCPTTGRHCLRCTPRRCSRSGHSGIFFPSTELVLAAL
ncbi:hypothetical protein BH10ACT9_BH10ACT9_58870 [soil metagenome]